MLVGPEWGLFKTNEMNLFGGGVLGDGLGALGDGVLGQLSGKEKSDGSLHFSRGDGRPLVVVGEAGSFGADSLEDVVHERVHDGHGLRRDSGVGVDLLQHLVDVDAVGFLPPLPLFLVGLGDRLLGFRALLHCLSGYLGSHDC